MENKLEVQEVTRGSGILLAVSSLPSPYGIGTLGDAARQFVDLLVDLKQKYWQILPVGPTSYGDSPYQTMSAFAGSPYLIDLDELIEDGLLTKDEISCYNWGLDESTIDYATLFDNRFRVLHQAFERFDESGKSRSVIRGIGREPLKPLQKEVSPMKTKTPKKRGVER